MRILRVITLCTLAGLLAATASAQTKEQAEAQFSAAAKAAKAVLVQGPAAVPLVDQASLDLPAGFAFVPGNEARDLLYAMGNRPNEDTIGLILPAGEGDWFVSVRYIKAGYIKDDDARDWNADDMLDQIKSGTEDANKERAARGIPGLDVIGWVEKPHYDAASHQLKWSIAARDKGAPADALQSVNYNTYALGREGFISMNLVTDLRTVEAEKAHAAKLLAALKFNDGKRYADFNSATDHVAEIGLAALVGGVAAKKLGLFALLAAFFAKFAKVIILAVLAFGAGAVKWTKGRNAKKATVLTTTAPVDPPPAEKPPGSA